MKTLLGMWAVFQSPLIWGPLLVGVLVFAGAHVVYFIGGYRLYRKIGWSRGRSAIFSLVDLPIVMRSE